MRDSAGIIDPIDEITRLQRRVVELELELRQARQLVDHERAAAALARESASRAWRLALSDGWSRRQTRDAQ